VRVRTRVRTGIAKAAQDAVDTTTVSLKGKSGYMAPEYVTRGQLDARSDVFALGVVAWEALTGRRLFEGDTDMARLRQVVATQAPPPSSVAPWLDPALDRPILRALAKDPDARTPAARAFAEELGASARRGGLDASGADVGAYVRAYGGAADASRDRKRWAPSVTPRTSSATTSSCVNEASPAPQSSTYTSRSIVTADGVPGSAFTKATNAPPADDSTRSAFGGDTTTPAARAKLPPAWDVPSQEALTGPASSSKSSQSAAAACAAQKRDVTASGASPASPRSSAASEPPVSEPPASSAARVASSDQS